MHINFVPGLAVLSQNCCRNNSYSYMEASMQSLLTKPVFRSNYVNTDVSFATKLDSYACML